MAVSRAASLPRDMPSTTTGTRRGGSASASSRSPSRKYSWNLAQPVRQARSREVGQRQGGESGGRKGLCHVGRLAATRPADDHDGGAGLGFRQEERPVGRGVRYAKQPSD